MKKNNFKNLSPVTAESKTERMRITAQVRKKKRHRRDAALSALLILLVICVCVIVVYCTDIFTVRSIVINADGERYQYADITNASGIGEGDRLFLIRTKEACKKIVTALPYIQTADINRSIDGTVTLDLHYGKAEYYVSGTAGLVLLDSQGKVLENDVALEPDDAAQLRGVTLSSATPGYAAEMDDNDIFKKARRLASLLSENGIDEVTGYDFTSETAVRVEIAYRVVVNINSLEEVEGKLGFLSEALSMTLQRAPAGERIVFELTNGGAWSARGENSIEQAEREARERLTSTQCATDSEGNTVESQPTTAIEETSAVIEESASAVNDTTEPSTVSDTTEEPVYG